MINITDAAVEVVKAVKDKENQDDLVLRLGVQGGGCSGLAYKMGFSKISDTDKVFDMGGVTIAVDSRSYLYLDGATIDYVNGPQGEGFTFDNPNIQPTCGCQSSH